MSEERSNVDRHTKDKHRNTSTKDERHDIFSEWIRRNLLDWSGQSESDIRRVLDVAGGKGFLSQALVSLGVRCALVDPCAGTGRELGAAGFFDPYCQQCGDSSATARPALSHTESAPMLVVPCTLQEVVQSELSLITESAAIVGLHPDEATEAIVDTALAYQLPFAIVPCCVTPQLFPHRVLKGTRTRVKKHGSFVKYLMDKDTRMRKIALPFQGRNVVLFMAPSDYLKKINTQASIPCDFRPCAAAAKAGNLELLQELRETGHPWNAECAQAAAWNGHLHVLQWLQQCGCPFDRTAYEAATKAGRCDVMDWLTAAGHLDPHPFPISS